MDFKRTILTQEVLRVLLHCSSLPPWEVTASHVLEMMRRNQYSGYNQRFRYQVLSSGLKAYERIIKDNDSGERPMYRTKEWQKEERENQKKRKSKEWYNKGGYKSVIFVPATPSSRRNTKTLLRNYP